MLLLFIVNFGVFYLFLEYLDLRIFSFVAISLDIVKSKRMEFAYTQKTWNAFIQ